MSFEYCDRGSEIRSALWNLAYFLQQPEHSALKKMRAQEEYLRVHQTWQHHEEACLQCRFAIQRAADSAIEIRPEAP